MEELIDNLKHKGWRKYIKENLKHSLKYEKEIIKKISKEKQDSAKKNKIIRNHLKKVSI